MRAQLIASLVAIALAACEPIAGGDEPIWMLGTWSDRAEGAGIRDVSYVDVHDDGTLVKSGIGGCGEVEHESREYRWRSVGADAIEVTDLDGSPMDEWDEGPVHFSLRDVCDDASGSEHLSTTRFDGSEAATHDETSYIRGQTCLDRLERPADLPQGFEWDDCRAVWCDGEPPPALSCLP